MATRIAKVGEDELLTSIIVASEAALYRSHRTCACFVRRPEGPPNGHPCQPVTAALTSPLGEMEGGERFLDSTIADYRFQLANVKAERCRNCCACSRAVPATRVDQPSP